MANSRTSGGTNKAYATVDTNPGAAGYFTESICPRQLLKEGRSLGKVYFSIRETTADKSANPSVNAVITVAIQFKCEDDAGWTDYSLLVGTLAIGKRFPIEDLGAGVLWRAGVRDDEYTSGSVTFGFDW
jgi:hypothetical protein